MDTFGVKPHDTVEVKMHGHQTKAVPLTKHGPEHCQLEMSCHPRLAARFKHGVNAFAQERLKTGLFSKAIFCN